MIGLLVKLAILFGVIFGVAFAIARSLRSRTHSEMSQELREAQTRFLELKDALEAGRLSKEEEKALEKWAKDTTAELPESLRDAGKPGSVPVQSIGDADE